MRKASRLFEIIQILRLARRPTTAAEIARRLEVAPRSVYRDIAALQAMRVPIEGERGLGYILRPGFNLPPLMFTVEEIEAVVLAVGLLDRTGDGELKEAAQRVSNKIASALPEPLRRWLAASALHAWGGVAPAPENLDLAILRRAIREERKLKIDYRDAEGRETHRVIWPAALIYYSDAVNLVAWCEMRQALRHFRAERIRVCEALDAHFKGEGDGLRRLWTSGWERPPPHGPAN